MDLEQKSIERIQLAAMMSEQYYDAPLTCTYSGGKDSDVMLELFKRSEVNFEVQNLNKKVNVWLKDGYELAGGVSMSVVGGGYFAAQAVVKNRREKNDISGSN